MKEHHQTMYRRNWRLSILLAEALSEGRSEFELANRKLENILLNEIDGQVGRVDSILQHLNNSSGSLRKMMKVIMDLRHKMDEENYQDLPVPDTNYIEDFGGECLEAGIHLDAASWDVIADEMHSGGFRAVLDLFDEHVQGLMCDTSDCYAAVHASNQRVKAGELTAVLKCNGPENFKREFFKLHASWEQLNQQFQASNIISTQLWYQFDGTGSLLGQVTPDQAVA